MSVHKFSLQFKKVEDHGRIAFEGWMSVWNENKNNGHILIASPTLDTLEADWNRITKNTPKFERDLAQHVFIVQAP